MRTSVGSRAVWGIFVGAVLSLPAQARAQASACARIEAAAARDRSVGALLGLAECEERIGRVASAWTHWGEAQALAEKKRDRRNTLAARRRDALAARLPKIQFDVPAGKSGLDVYRDEVRIDPATYGVPIPTDPGPHVISVRRGAEVLSSQQVNAAEGQVSRVPLDLAALDRPAAPPAAGAPAPPPPVVVAQPAAGAPAPPPPVVAQPSGGGGGGLGGKQKLIGAATLGVGAATLAVALGLEIAALADRTSAFASDSCSNGFCTQAGHDAASKARTFADAGQWVGIGGLVVAGAGLAVLLTAPKGAPAPRTAISVSGWAAPGAGGIGLRGVLR